MKKNIFMLITCLALVLCGAVSFAAMYGHFEGFPVVKVLVDGREITGDVPAIVLNGRTMVPVRFVSEALGSNVTWDAENETVLITTGKTTVSSTETGKNEYIVTDDSGNALYSFKINKITEMTERNQFSDKNPAQVIMIDYTYTNIASSEDVYLSDIYFKVVDSAGNIGYTYPNSKTKYPQSIPLGVTCNAQMIFGLDNKSDTVKIYFYKDILGEVTATFELPVE